MVRNQDPLLHPGVLQQERESLLHGREDCDSLWGQESPGAGGELGDYEAQHEAPKGDENQPVNNVNILFLLDSVVLTCVPVYKQ